MKERGNKKKGILFKNEEGYEINEERQEQIKFNSIEERGNKRNGILFKNEEGYVINEERKNTERFPFQINFNCLGA